MANTAAHLVDRVLPAVPVRQWVLSLPFELRALAAFRADVLSAVGRIFVEEIFARQRSWARREGLGAAPSGAITFVQRFGSSVDLKVHFHVVVLDGVFTRDERGNPLFHPTPPPRIEELGQAQRRVSRRVVTWLTRQGRLASQSSASTCTRASPSPATTTSVASAFAATARVRRSRSTACGVCPTGASPTASRSCAAAGPSIV